MSQGRLCRTLGQAIEDLVLAPSRGFYFLEEGADGALQETYLPFPELAAHVTRRAAALQAAGLRRGDRLAIILPDTRAFVTTFLGAILAGIAPVPIYPPTGVVQLERYATTVGAIVARSQARALVATAAFDNMRRAVEATCAAPLALLTPAQLESDTSTFRHVGIEPDDVAFLQFTSGSTSLPKGVRVTHANIAANTAAIDAAFALTTDDVPVSWLPLFHDMGLIGFLLTSLYATVSTRFLPTHLFLRRPGTWLRTISRHRGTISVAPNFAFALVTRRLKDEEIAKLDLSSWRIAGCGAEPIRAADLEHFARRLAPAGFRPEAFLPMYGLAEATLAVTIPPLGSGLRCASVDAAKLRTEQAAVASEGPGSVRIANCGPALPINEIAVFAPEDADSARPLPEGSVGEIRVRGPNVMSGYWEDAAATRAAFAGGWLKTGDLGFLQAGDLHVCGRLKELIIVNGRNYFPDDIERLAVAVPGVRAAMAFQTRHAWLADGSGAKVVLAVEAPAPEKIDAAQLHRAVNTELGLGLDDIVFLAPGQLPKTSSGKPRRAEACRLYEAGALRRRPRGRAASTNNDHSVERDQPQCLTEQ